MAAVLLSVLSVAVWFAYTRGVSAGIETVLVLIGISSAGLALFCGVHWSREIFALWNRCAVALQAMVAFSIFAAVYIVLVPIFSMLMFLGSLLRRLRGRATETFWVHRSENRCDWDSMKRMG